MQHVTTALLVNKSFLKVVALFIAYFYWSLLSDFFPLERTFMVPVTISAQSLIVTSAPPIATITLRGLRKHMRALDPLSLTLTIPESELNPGFSMITLKNKHLALPSCIALVNYYPINFVINTLAIAPLQQH